VLRVDPRARLTAVVVVAALVLVAVWWHHGSRPTEGFSGSASVVSSGLQVTAQSLVATPAQDVTADYAGVCFTDATGARVDFPLQRDVPLASSPVTLVSTGTLPAGSYSFGSCVRVDGVWSAAGPTATVDLSPGATSQTVATPTDTVPTAQAPSSGVSDGSQGESPATGSTGSPSSDVPSADASLPIGDLPGWRQLLAEDFSTDVPEGDFPGRAYRDRWAGYDGFDDSSGSFRYETADVASVHDGVLDLRTRTEGSTAMGAGVAAQVNGDGTWGGRAYGRYSVRFRADPGAGWGAAFLLWSDTDTWTDGEIDFAEGLTTATTVDAHNHALVDPAQNALSVYTPATWDSWHVATVEWTPDAVRFHLDGHLTGTSTQVPTRPLHLVLQTVTDKRVPPADSTAHVLVDWVAAYERD
jgi:hypothetical protein